VTSDQCTSQRKNPDGLDSIHVDHNVPRTLAGAGNGAAEPEDLARKHPPDQADRVLALVVRRYRDVNVFEGGVRVAEGDDGDVDVAGLADGLVVDTRVRHDNEPGLLERSCDVVGEAAWREPARNRLCARVGGVLEHSSMAVRTSRDGADVVGVLNSGNNASSEDELLPGLADVDEVDPFQEACRQHTASKPVFAQIKSTICASLVDVGCHLLVVVLGADVALTVRIRFRQNLVRVFLGKNLGTHAARRSWTSSSVAFRAAGRRLGVAI
jgi:hypothetical protein